MIVSRARWLNMVDIDDLLRLVYNGIHILKLLLIRQSSTSHISSIGAKIPRYVHDIFGNLICSPLMFKKKLKIVLSTYFLVLLVPLNSPIAALRTVV